MIKKILQLNNKIQYLLILGVLGLISIPFVSKAVDTVTISNPIGSTTLSGFIEEILKIVITIATPIAILAIIYSGFLFVKARGNPEGIIKAREALMWTLIGVAVLLGAQLLSTVIQGTITSLGA